MASDRRAFALIIVLVTMASLFAMAIPVAVRSRAAVIEAAALREQTLARRNARTAISLALVGMIPSNALEAPADTDTTRLGGRQDTSGGAGSGEGSDNTSIPEFLIELIPELKELQEQNEDELEAQAAGLARFISSVNISTPDPPEATELLALSTLGLPIEPLELPFDNQSFTLAFSDAFGRLNINLAEHEQLVAYFDAKGFDPRETARLADQILDWRDEDSVRREYGAEQEIYQRQRITCRNSDFSSVEELLFLPAVTPEVLDRVRDDLTILSDGRVHINSASREVLLSVPGASPEVVRQLLSVREERPLTQNDVNAMVPIRMMKFREGTRVQPSNMLRVDIVARKASGAPIARFVAHAMLGDGGMGPMSLTRR